MIVRIQNQMVWATQPRSAANTANVSTRRQRFGPRLLRGAVPTPDMVGAYAGYTSWLAAVAFHCGFGWARVDDVAVVQRGVDQPFAGQDAHPVVEAVGVDAHVRPDT